MDFDEDHASWIELAVDEAVINAITHGNNSSPDKQVDVPMFQLLLEQVEGRRADSRGALDLRLWQKVSTSPECHSTKIATQELATANQWSVKQSLHDYSLGELLKNLGSMKEFDRALDPQDKDFGFILDKGFIVGKRIGVDESVDKRKAAQRAAVKY